MENNKKRFFDFDKNEVSTKSPCDFVDFSVESSISQNDTNIDNILLNLNVRGCLWGAICGDVIGYRYKYTDSASKLKKDLSVCKKSLDVLGGGIFKLNIGQLGSLSEIMVTLLYSIVTNQCIYNPVVATRYYGIWYNSGIFEKTGFGPKNINTLDLSIQNAFTINYGLDETTNYEKILANSDKLNFDNKTGTFLIRCIPIAIYFYYQSKNVSFNNFITYITEDCKITHPHDDCINMALMYAYSIFLSLSGTNKNDIFNTIINTNFRNDTHKKILRDSQFSPKYDTCSAWKEFHFGCSIQSAFYYFMNGESIENAFKNIIEAGGNTDLNCAIFGALYGAYYGFTSIPKRWIDSVTDFDDYIGSSAGLRYETLNYLKPYKIDIYLKKIEGSI